MIFNLKNNNSGFTLLELLLYVAILAGFLMVIVNIFFSITTSSSKEEARNEVRQNLRFSSQQITDEIRKASSINSISVGGDVLNVTVDGVATEFKVVSGVLKKVRGASTENITSDKVVVSITDPVFVQSGDTIQINLKIDYNDKGKGDYKFSETVKTTVSMRL